MERRESQKLWGKDFQKREEGGMKGLDRGKGSRIIRSMANTHGAEPKGVGLGALLLKDKASCPIKGLDKGIDFFYTISAMVMPNRCERTGARSLNDNLRSLDKNIERFRDVIKVNPGYSFRLSEVKPKNFWDSSGRMCVDTTRYIDS